MAGFELPITSLSAVFLAFLFIGLSVRVIRLRRRLQVGLGDGGQVELNRAMRVHANCAEYAPLGLILLALGELQGSPHWRLILLASVLVFGRLIHAYGVSQMLESFRLRVAGMAMTFAALTGLALNLIFRVLPLR